MTALLILLLSNYVFHTIKTKYKNGVLILVHLNLPYACNLSNVLLTICLSFYSSYLVVGVGLAGFGVPPIGQRAAGAAPRRFAQT